MKHSDETKRRIAKAVAQAHRRLCHERGSYLTPTGHVRLREKCAAYYTPERRRWHGERQRPALEAAHRACISAADRFARRFLPLLIEMRNKGMNLRKIADEMNRLGYTTRQGKAWTNQAVRQVFKRRKNIIAGEPIRRVRYIGWNRITRS